MKKINLVYGTVYGSAQYVAETIKIALLDAGNEVGLHQADDLEGFIPPQNEILLIVCATTGQGDVPDDIYPWFSELKNAAPYLPNLEYSVIALGDSSYETFCGAGLQFDALLSELGAKRLGEVLKIDAGETMEPEVEALKWIESWQSLL
ncbi:flavodoxin [uncultured Shewanella sp.]|uniref:flavodoxin n=1 Tax=uncultured Shewanella sp. TaxID=173975 RepID=UPI00261A67F5|nr:flavodoxin [uncultured Shewanella sp.]